MKHLTLCAVVMLGCLTACNQSYDSPRSVNIINFIRLSDPRSTMTTREVLFNTVQHQVEDMRGNGLIGTWLLQYDALIDPEYQALMKEEMARGCEIGGWWEITKPHALAAGIEWRGRTDWDPRACVGFSLGYDSETRKVLCDTYMETFKEIFGEYPKSIGSWFIDAETLAYLYDKYGIEASCNCRDQIGTDGYTLWGGYWNGAFYPSRQNAYMPAQTEEGGIGVPIFRMLGSDPMYQYDWGVGGLRQGVMTMEPVYPYCGGDPDWVDWYLRMFTDEPHLSYNNVQVGQENAFTWKRFGEGFKYQMKRVAELDKEGKLKVETLLQTARAFKSKYPSLTPPSSIVVTEDARNSGCKTYWFNCRNYRANLFWNGNTLKFRDIHVFDENLRSEYLDHPDTLPVFRFETLPLVDGVVWSTESNMAGLYLVAPGFKGGTPVFRTIAGGNGQQIEWPSTDGRGRFVLTFTEDCISIRSRGKVDGWHLDMSVNPGTELPFTSISETFAEAEYLGRRYGLSLSAGCFEDLRKEGFGKVFRIVPDGGKVTFGVELKGEAEVESAKDFRVEAVDLGLSVKWCNANLGAGAPDEYGDYYAWGETEPKEEFSWKNYKLGTGVPHIMTKYNTSTAFGKNVDWQIVLDRPDDAASATLGGNWRLPTAEEVDELSATRKNPGYKWEWKTVNGHNGWEILYLANGNSIFLPAAGYRTGKLITGEGLYGSFWSSTIYSDFAYDSWYLGTFSGSSFRYFHNRFLGMSVRPVSD